MNLKAIVIGAGWAGEGHTNALRYCGVEVADIRGEPHRPYLTFYDVGAIKRPSTLSAADVGGVNCRYRPDTKGW